MTKSVGEHENYFLYSSSDWANILIISTIISLFFLLFINICYFIIYCSFLRNTNERPLQGNQEREENEIL